MKTVEMSVIIPVYNAQEYLRHLLFDIQRQKGIDFEVILIDDGSSDNSFKICKEFAVKDSRFHYYRQQNKGVSAARNKGIEKAKGDYIIFLDSDDRIPEDSFRKLLDPMKSYPKIDLVIGKYKAVGDFKKDEELFWQSDVLGRKHYEEMLLDCISAAISFYYGCVWNKLYRKSIIIENQIRFDEKLKWCEDFIFNMGYFQYVQFCYYLTDVIYHYCYRSGSASTQDEIIDDRMDFLRYQYLMNLNKKIKDTAVRELYKRKVKLFLIHRMHGVLSEKAKKWSIFNQKGYQEWKDYFYTTGDVSLWKEKNIVSELTAAEKVTRMMIRLKLYHFTYIYYVIKSRMKKRSSK